MAATPAATVDIAESNCSSACVAGFVIGVVGAAVLLLGIMYLSMVAYNRFTRERWLDADACPPEQSMPQPMQQSMPQPTVCEVQPPREEYGGGVPDATRVAEKVEPGTDARRPEQPQPLQPAAYDLQPLQCEEDSGVVPDATCVVEKVEPDANEREQGEVECEEGEEVESEEDVEEDAEAALCKEDVGGSMALGPEGSEVLPHFVLSEK